MNINQELIEACRTGDLIKVKELISAGADISYESDDTDDYGATTLIIAAGENQLDVLKYIIEHSNTNINVTDYSGRTPLIIAATNGFIDVVKYLVEKKAAVNMYDTDGLTALDYAVEFEHEDVAEYLLDLGVFIYPLALFTHIMLKIIHKKQKKKTVAQSLLSYYLQFKTAYTPQQLQIFKHRFLLLLKQNEEDLTLIGPIVKFL